MLCQSYKYHSFKCMENNQIHQASILFNNQSMMQQKCMPNILLGKFHNYQIKYCNIKSTSSFHKLFQLTQQEKYKLNINQLYQSKQNSQCMENKQYHLANISYRMFSRQQKYMLHIQYCNLHNQWFKNHNIMLTSSFHKLFQLKQQEKYKLNINQLYQSKQNSQCMENMLYHLANISYHMFSRQLKYMLYTQYYNCHNQQFKHYNITLISSFHKLLQLKQQEKYKLNINQLYQSKPNSQCMENKQYHLANISYHMFSRQLKYMLYTQYYNLHNQQFKHYNITLISSFHKLFQLKQQEKYKLNINQLYQSKQNSQCMENKQYHLANISYHMFSRQLKYMLYTQYYNLHNQQFKHYNITLISSFHKLFQLKQQEKYKLNINQLYQSKQNSQCMENKQYHLANISYHMFSRQLKYMLYTQYYNLHNQQFKHYNITLISSFHKLFQLKQQEKYKLNINQLYQSKQNSQCMENKQYHLANISYHMFSRQLKYMLYTQYYNLHNQQFKHYNITLISSFHKLFQLKQQEKYKLNINQLYQSKQNSQCMENKQYHLANISYHMFSRQLKYMLYTQYYNLHNQQFKHYNITLISSFHKLFQLKQQEKYKLNINQLYQSKQNSQCMENKQYHLANISYHMFSRQLKYMLYTQYYNLHNQQFKHYNITLISSFHKLFQLKQQEKYKLNINQLYQSKPNSQCMENMLYHLANISYHMFSRQLKYMLYTQYYNCHNQQFKHYNIRLTSSFHKQFQLILQEKYKLSISLLYQSKPNSQCMENKQYHLVNISYHMFSRQQKYMLYIQYCNLHNQWFKHYNIMLINSFHKLFQLILQEKYKLNINLLYQSKQNSQYMLNKLYH